VECGKGITSKVVRIQLRPDPIAKMRITVRVRRELEKVRLR
jgi:hypothetical protein